jgi:RNA-directed DNA polymerase
MTKTSIGVQELRTRIGEKAKADPQHRFWGLYTHVWKLDVLREAYRLAKRNDGAPGVDGVTFEQVEREGVEPMLESLSRELRDKSYEPLPSRHVNIPKEGGKVRGLKIPAIRDRVVQGAVRLILEPIFEADFQPGSYGYRPGRSAHDALERVRVGLCKQLHQVIDLDLKSYFDTVRCDLLLSKIARRVRDDDVLWLCKRILKASGKRGLPQGSVIGPLWANVFLDDVDRMLEQAQSATHLRVVPQPTLCNDPNSIGVQDLFNSTGEWKSNADATSNDQLNSLFRTLDGTTSPNDDVSTPAARTTAYPPPRASDG